MSNNSSISDEMLMNDMANYFEEGLKETVYGNYDKPVNNEHWTGRVTSNMDPLMLGRVQVMIYGVYDDIPLLGLPWAVPDIKYLGSSYGNMIIPTVGTNLRGYFDHGDIHKPIYDSIAFDYNNQYSFATAAERKIGYPNNMILLETELGDSVTMNRYTAETKIKLHNGLAITMTINGDIDIRTGAAGSLNVTSLVNTSITTIGNTTIDSKGLVEINGGLVTLGANEAKQLVNNLPICPVTGLPHYVGNTNVFV